MKGTSQALNLRKSTYDNGCGMFLRMLEYKLMFFRETILENR